MNTDFDFLLALHEDDPEKFEEYRLQVLEDFFNNLPEENQLKARQAQWRLDNDLRKYKDPIARMNRMVELFWEQTNEFKDTLKEFK